MNASPASGPVAAEHTADIGLVEARYFTFATPPDEMSLESGEKLGPITLAYETYGALNEDASNAILVVARHDRTGQGVRHRAILRHLLERPRRLPGFDGAVVTQSCGREAIRTAVPSHHCG
jgi:hypothetical protein